jgi:hypothetical protein
MAPEVISLDFMQTKKSKRKERKKHYGMDIFFKLYRNSLFFQIMKNISKL